MRPLIVLVQLLFAVRENETRLVHADTTYISITEYTLSYLETISKKKLLVAFDNNKSHVSRLTRMSTNILCCWLFLF